MQVFIRRVSFYIVNKNVVEVLMSLIKRSRNSNDTTNQSIGMEAEKLIKDISKHFPSLYKTQVESLYTIIQQESNSQLITDALQALSKFVKVFPENCPQDTTTFKKLLDFAKNDN